MIQKRRIAIVYSFAVPLLFAFLMLEVGAVYRFQAHSREIDRRVSALTACDDALFAIRGVDGSARAYIATGRDAYRDSYGEAVSRLAVSMARLGELSHGDAAIQSKMQSLSDMITVIPMTLQQPVTSTKEKATSDPILSGDARFTDVLTQFAGTAQEIRATQLNRVEQDRQRATQSADWVDTLVKYGGVMTIWFVGVAALLLFYDDSAQNRTRIEQRLHTDMLDEFPLGVCLVTESGVILYANRAAEDIFGYSAGELVAKSIALLRDNGERGIDPGLLEVLGGLGRSETWFGDIPIRTKDNGTIKVASWIASIPVGKKNCRLMIQDQSARRAADQDGHRVPQSKQLHRGAEEIEGPPQPPAPDGQHSTKPRDSEAISASGPAK